MSKTIFIGGRLESKEKGNVVAGANAILDNTKGKKQNVINKETDDELLRLEQSKQDNLTFDNAPTEDSTNPVTSGGVYTAEKALSDAIEAILLLIPSAATALNKLVDTNTMNSSISTATATFRGTYNAVSDLGLTYQATHAQIEAALDALGLTADNNDYAFVQVPVSDQSQDIAKTERYKNNGTNWQYEYDLNTSGFTADQWAAINSGITVALVTKLTDLPTAAAFQLALNAKQDTLTFDTEPTALSQNPVTSGGIYTAIQAIATALSDYSTTTDDRLGALEGLIPSEAASNNKLTDKAYVDGLIQAITELIPAEATTTNQLADKAYVLASILVATPAFKGQFTTLAELQAVASPKDGDLGIVRTKDSDGMDVFTVYQYLNNAWNVFYSLSYHPQTKPATTGTTGDYPYNGMGRVELAKNMVNGVNTLTQDMFYKGEVGSRVPNTNTIFVIQYDYVLAENITIPDNCVLEFEGGSISDDGTHTLTGTNSGINAGLVKIFNTDITLAGTWNVAESYPEWFGAVGDLNVTDDTVAIQKAIDFAEARGNGKGKVKLSKGHRLNSTITIRNCSFDGGGNVLSYYGNATAISLLGNHYMTTIENFVLANSGGEGLNGIKNENEGADTSSGLNNAWIKHITVYSFKQYGFHFRNAWLCNLEGLRAESCKNTNNDAVGLYVDRAYNSKFYNINAEDNNIGISLHCLSTSFRGVCVDKCTHIGIAVSYVIGCSIEDFHFECGNENVSGIKILDGSGNTFKNIFMSTNKTGFKAFDFSGLGADVHSTGHIFQDLHFSLQADSITFALHTTSIDYPRIYDCTVLNKIIYENHGLLYTGNGYIRFLNTSNTTGHNKDILVEVNNGSPRIIPNSSEQISNNFAIISDCASIHGDGSTKGIYDLSRSFIGFIFVYTNKAFAIYSNIAYDANVPNLIFTSDSNVFNTTDGIRWSTPYSTIYTLIIPGTFGTSDIVNVELKELKFT